MDLGYEITRTEPDIQHTFNKCELLLLLGLPKCFSGKETAYSAGDPPSIPGLGRSPGGGNGYPLQYSGLKNPKDRGAWWVTVHGVTKSQTRPRVTVNTVTF